MKGFSLVELLTVVIIIAILASIALPQYQRAVEKSRAAEALTMGKIIVDSQNRLIDLFPNDSVGSRNALDVILSGGTWNTNDRSATVYTTQLFEYTLSDNGVAAARVNGPYNYTLHFHNNKSNLSNTCTGDNFCNNMRGLGFSAEQAQ